MADHPPVAIITGAGSGIGRAAAQQLAGLGWSVALVGRTQRTLEQTAEDCGSSLVIEADLAAPGTAERIIDATIKRFGGLDALVNNAGTGSLVPIDQTSSDLLTDVFALNTFAPALLIANAWPHLIARGGGRIVQVSSMATVDPFPGFFVYAASKAAVESQARSCAIEGAEFGIRAFAIAPGAVETRLLRSIVSVDDLAPEQCMSPESVAGVIVQCVTGQRDGESGKTIVLDGP